MSLTKLEFEPLIYSKIGQFLIGKDVIRFSMITKDTHDLFKQKLITLKQDYNIKEIVSILYGYSNIFVIFKISTSDEWHTALIELGDQTLNQRGFTKSKVKFQFVKQCKNIVKLSIKQIITENDVQEIQFLNVVSYRQDCPFNQDILISMNKKLVDKYNKEKKHNQAINILYNTIRQLHLGKDKFDIAKKNVEEQVLPAIFWDKPDSLTKHLNKLSKCNELFKWLLMAYRILLPGAKRINYSLCLWNVERYNEECVLHNAINNKYISKII